MAILYGTEQKIWRRSERSGNSSYGNGAVMRISPVAYYARNLKELDRIAYDVTAVSHNHEYAIKGAHTVARAVYMALHGASKDDIKRFVSTKYDIGFTIDGIRELYQFSAATQDTVAPAVVAFLESNSFEEAIKSVISIGGDSDTLAAVCGAIAGAYYGVDETLEQRATRYLDNRLLKIYEQTKR